MRSSCGPGPGSSGWPCSRRTAPSVTCSGGAGGGRWWCWLGTSRCWAAGVFAAGVFAAGALGLALAQLTGFAVTQGPGTYLSGGLAAAAAATWYGRQARPAIRHLILGWARYAGAR